MRIEMVIRICSQKILSGFPSCSMSWLGGVMLPLVRASCLGATCSTLVYIFMTRGMV